MFTRKSFFIFFAASLVLISFTIGCAKKEIIKGEPTVKENVVAAKPADVKEPDQSKTAIPKEDPGKTVTVAPQAAVPQTPKTKPEPRFRDRDIHFDFDEYTLKPESRQTLKEYADLLRKKNDYNVRIEGHCDERGTSEYNLALGQRRAEEAMNYLVTLGIDTARIKTISYGEEMPVDPRSDEEAWAKNRRDHFIVTQH
jgi:peptidoglycan-associated lipoprotein